MFDISYWELGIGHGAWVWGIECELPDSPKKLKEERGRWGEGEKEFL
jgi:hypothetical protein